MQVQGSAQKKTAFFQIRQVPYLPSTVPTTSFFRSFLITGGVSLYRFSMPVLVFLLRFSTTIFLKSLSSSTRKSTVAGESQVPLVPAENKYSTAKILICGKVLCQGSLVLLRRHKKLYAITKMVPLNNHTSSSTNRPLVACFPLFQSPLVRN